jgi:hypothetical protein
MGVLEKLVVTQGQKKKKTAFHETCRFIHSQEPKI